MLLLHESKYVHGSTCVDKYIKCVTDVAESADVKLKESRSE